MKYWVTKLGRDEIIKIFNAGGIDPNSICLLHHNDGETFVCQTSKYNNSVIEKSGSFYEKEMDDIMWQQFQIEKRFSITGNPTFAPFTLTPSNRTR